MGDEVTSSSSKRGVAICFFVRKATHFDCFHLEIDIDIYKHQNGSYALECSKQSHRFKLTQYFYPNGIKSSLDRPIHVLKVYSSSKVRKGRLLEHCCLIEVL